MFTRKFFYAAVAPAAFAAFAGATAPASSASAAQSCVFDKYAPVSVAPYNTDETFGYGTHSLLRGAQLYIPAQEGLTKEWLELSVQRALASDQTCRPDVKTVKVTVTSAGNGFWVQLIARDEAQANALLRWAKSVVHQAPQSTASAAR